MDQAVGLRQEQVQVLNGEKETAFQNEISSIFHLSEEISYVFLMQVSGKNLLEDK